MTKEEAEAKAKVMGLDPKDLYWCVCCQTWAHKAEPCECAYELCLGLCKKTEFEQRVACAVLDMERAVGQAAKHPHWSHGVAQALIPGRNELFKVLEIIFDGSSMIALDWLNQGEKK